jgi:Preprotein translocase subunit SecB
MKPSPLTLEGYYLRELSVEMNPKFEKGQNLAAWLGFHYHPDESYEPDLITYEANGAIAIKKDDPLRRIYELKITSDRSPRKKFPYFFEIAVEGYFRIAEDYPAEKVELLFHANAPALLYAAAREILAVVTGRGPFPAVILPSVSFLDDAEAIIKQGS